MGGRKPGGHADVDICGEGADVGKACSMVDGFLALRITLRRS